MRLFRLNIIILLVIGMLASCEGLVQENEEEGKYMFWSNFDGPPIDIFVNNNFYGTISTFYSSTPDCDASGCVTVILPTGNYNFEAVEQANNSGSQRDWSGSFEIKPNVCGKLGLSP
jgi:hypothetical protein